MQNKFVFSVLSVAALLSACHVNKTNSGASEMMNAALHNLKLENLVAILPDFAEPDYVVFGTTENHSGETIIRSNFKIVLGGDCKDRSLLVSQSGNQGFLSCVTSTNKPAIKIATLGEGKFVDSSESTVPDKVIPLKFVPSVSLKHISGNTYELNVKGAEQSADEVDIFVGQEIWIFKNVKPFDVAGKIHCHSNKNDEDIEISLKDSCSVDAASQKLSCDISGFLMFSSELRAQWSRDWVDAVNSHSVPNVNSTSELRWSLRILDGSKKQISSCYQTTSGTFVRAE